MNCTEIKQITHAKRVGGRSRPTFTRGDEFRSDDMQAELPSQVKRKHYFCQEANRPDSSSTTRLPVSSRQECPKKWVWIPSGRASDSKTEFQTTFTMK